MRFFGVRSWVGAVAGCAMFAGCKTAATDSGMASGDQAAAHLACDNNKLVPLVQTFNQTAWNFSPQAKALQVAAMKESAAEFYRVTPYLFYALVRQRMQSDPGFAASVNSAGSGPTFADLHPLNVAWQNNGGMAVAWVNDFDDTTVAPFAAEILRSVTSVLIFVPDAIASEVSASFLKAYSNARAGIASGDRGADLNRIAALSASASPDDADLAAQPDIGKNALALALKTLAAAAPVSLRNIADCKASYKTYAGGSSNGLPRFRFKCGNNTYEIKAARGAAWDVAGSAGVKVGGAGDAQRIVNGAHALAAPEAGQFFVAGGLLGQSWAGPWNYYGHQRLGNSFNIDKMDDADAVSLAAVLGGLAGAGHRRVGAAPLGAGVLSGLQGFVPVAAEALAQTMQSLQQSLPSCLLD